MSDRRWRINESTPEMLDAIVEHLSNSDISYSEFSKKVVTLAVEIKRLQAQNARLRAVAIELLEAIVKEEQEYPGVSPVIMRKVDAVAEAIG